MTKEVAIHRLLLARHNKDTTDLLKEALDMAIEALRQEPSAESHKCHTCRYRNLEWYEEPCDSCTGGGVTNHYKPSKVPEIIRCNDCKHFHYDKPYIVQGIPVLGHEVCDFWGDGCKTSVYGFCSMAERKEE